MILNMNVRGHEYHNIYKPRQRIREPDFSNSHIGLCQFSYFTSMRILYFCHLDTHPLPSLRLHVTIPTFKNSSPD